MLYFLELYLKTFIRIFYTIIVIYLSEIYSFTYLFVDLFIYSFIFFIYFIGVVQDWIIVIVSDIVLIASCWLLCWLLSNESIKTVADTGCGFATASGMITILL